MWVTFIIKVLRNIDFKIKKLLFLSCFLGVLLFCIESGFVYVIQGFFRSLHLIPDDRLNLPAWYPKEIELSVLLLLGMGLSRSGLLILKQAVSSLVMLNFIYYNRNKIQRYSIFFADHLEISKILVLFNERVQQAAVVLQAISKIFMMSFSSILLFIFGMSFAPKLMFSATVTSMLFFFLIKFLGGKVVVLGNLIRKEQRKTASEFMTGFQQNFLLKIYGTLREYIESVERSLTKYKNLHFNFIILASLKTQFPNILGLLLLCLITIISIKFFPESDKIIYINFFYIFTRFAQSVSDVSGALAELNLQKGAFEEINNFNAKISKSNLDQKIKDYSSGFDKIFSLEKKIFIEIRNASFSYDGQKNILQNLNLKVEPGKPLLLKGPSGTGKSTILKLLTGSEQPSSGEVLINGVLLKEVQFNFRKLIAYVGPEPFIIHSSVKNNLLFGYNGNSESVTNDDLLNVLKKVELEERGLKLDQVISESMGLSTGQKQRIALARALLRNPRVLIIDEGTANLDKEAEFKVVNLLKSISLTGVTMVLVSHKNSFDDIAAEIVVLA